MSKPLKLFVIAGEASGDLHGSNMMKALLEENSSIDFRFWGGEKMKAVQPNGLMKHIEELAFMGFVEVLMNLRTILGNISLCKKEIENYQPDALVLIDYPGFNLRIAEWAKQKGIKVYYYISPQVWAWKQSRVHKIKKVVDKMYVILPFEQDFYKKFNFDVTYIGHPLIDEISSFKTRQVSLELDDERPILAVLPGSRKQEISKKLPVMLDAVRDIDSHQIVIAGAPSQNEETYKPYLNGEKIIFGSTYDLLNEADIAIVTSGTATLETALFKVPEVVCYKGSEISYRIAKRLIKVKFISLVNLIMDREVVKELIQKECNPTSIRKEIDLILNDENYRNRIQKDYDELEKILGGVGASKKLANDLLVELSDS